MTRARRPIAISLLLMAALLGVLVAHAIYSRIEVTGALEEFAREAGVRFEYEDASAWVPGRVHIDEPRIVDPDRGIQVQLPSLTVAYSPLFTSGERTVTVHVPDGRLSVDNEGLRVQSAVAGTAELITRAAEPPAAAVNTARVTLRDGRLEVGEAAASDLSVVLEVDAAEAERTESLRADVTARGPKAAALLELAGLRGVTAWIFPTELDGPFELEASIARLSEERLRVEGLRGQSGSVQIEGGLTWSPKGIDGALLLATEVRRVGLHIEDGALRPELSPEPDWLEKQLASIEPKLAQRDVAGP